MNRVTNKPIRDDNQSGKAGASRLLVCAMALLLTGCADVADQSASSEPAADTQPQLVKVAKQYLEIDGYTFKDLNDNSSLDPYEDWRLPTSERVSDLVARMTINEKAGMMLIQTLNAESEGLLPDKAEKFVKQEYMTRFIFRNPVVPNPDRSAPSGRSGAQITPFEAANYTNAIQALAESTRLGIPALFKSNARNHYEQDSRPGINLSAGSFSTWPKEAGLAATRDQDLIREFADIMRQEWIAIGLRGMYGYMADLSTEPRWYRVHETFTEDADLAADIITTLVTTLQGEQLSKESVALTIKHFPGGGPQAGGGDPHYHFGRNQSYPAGQFDAHLKPFVAAIDAGTSSIMAYYGIPVGQDYQPNDVGMAFSKGIVTGLLREKLGFKGYVNSDTGIIGPVSANRAWGLEDKSIEELLSLAIHSGTDVLSGFDDHSQILSLVESGLISEERLDLSVARLLKEQFELGLFENPYVDPYAATELVGNPEFQAKADLAQRKAIVLLKNENDLLPIKVTGKPVRLFTLGVDTRIESREGVVIESGETNPEAIANADYALIRVTVTNPVTDLSHMPMEPLPVPGLEPATIFGGAAPDELDFLAFSQMANTKSWVVTPSLEQINNTIASVGADKTILAVYFRQPYVMDDASGFAKVGAHIALFGSDDNALLDVVTGRFNPSGRLPFALANSAEAILHQAPDAPGYAPEDTLYGFGHGLSY
ncbi:glycoside hydrolase, family 3 domain protein [Aequoribacter fuscus]|uniref:beta-glucosidase n=1 Tax=Aequoribacter fuscus TaxID=2518989 RepID=F3L2G3_9GAMM|nr:glycoside hydrolase family 3 N-terminal domain-containing protein [Aequoribacter fuscus]EGG29490.1 glycoside hydrolase, family 3 domain protein [Aequoribacter fuscus]QHJ87312.1 glycoside hydrolase family 3 protein [Aequoribacter fuscus]